MNIQNLQLSNFKAQIGSFRAVMCLDYGEKRIGVAVSDLMLMTANPVEIITHQSNAKTIERLKQLIEEKEVGGIVLGLPLQMDGSEGERAFKTKAFAEKLTKEINIPIEFWDERMSSSAVERMLVKDLDMTRKKRKKCLDSGAASFILQGFLDAISSL